MKGLRSRRQPCRLNWSGVIPVAGCRLARGGLGFKSRPALGLSDVSDHVPDRSIATLHQALEESAPREALHFEHGFVGLNLQQNVPAFDGIACLFLPRDYSELVSVGSAGRHRYLGEHLFSHSLLYALSHLIIPGMNEFGDVDEGQLLRDRFEWRLRGRVGRKSGGT